ncbi:hypothetical protein [Massilia sp. Root418]|jgi:hypothetical protein|uniref:hypothetical protein n=1 Tax=Massilia sp. Root418 TaxID=1736532 RepID=UPI0012F63727|nr:hypothetical protein [Massilia sp. Root418]
MSMVIQTQAAGVPPAAYLELTTYLRTSNSTLSAPEALSHAVKHWIAAQREAAAAMRGYQWKCLFLPSRQFTLMMAGPGNAHANATHPSHVHPPIGAAHSQAAPARKWRA